MSMCACGRYIKAQGAHCVDCKARIARQAADKRRAELVALQEDAIAHACRIYESDNTVSFVAAARRASEPRGVGYLTVLSAIKSRVQQRVTRRAKVSKREAKKLVNRDGTARMNEANRHAFEDAKVWHEVGGLSLERSAKLSARFHGGRWHSTYKSLQRFYGYASGRPTKTRNTQIADAAE
jgi:hypothetical protein